jgi:hypothetical protein
VAFESALTGFETPLRLVDDVQAALAPHEAIAAVAGAQGLQRITDFHGQLKNTRKLAGFGVVLRDLTPACQRGDG